VPATPQNIENACQWIQQYQPQRGGTDMQTPLHWALHLLENQPLKAATIMPFIILLTDGKVHFSLSFVSFS
jgi:uncharacterized protein with von Willebrand factor type A (vWA) domain